MGFQKKNKVISLEIGDHGPPNSLTWKKASNHWRFPPPAAEGLTRV